MRAIAIRGDELRLEELPDPVPGSREVVVAAAHAGINPADLAQRAGRYPAPPGAPQDIPGLEVAGRVVARGEQVRDWQVGIRWLDGRLTQASAPATFRESFSGLSNDFKGFSGFSRYPQRSRCSFPCTE